MRFLYFLIFLLAAVLLASADSTLATSELTRPATQSLKLEDIHSKSNLRGYNDDDERGISIPGLNNAIKSMTTSKTKLQLQGLVDANDDLGKAYKTLGLSKIPIGEENVVKKEMVVKLLSSKEFKTWSKYAAIVEKQNPEAAKLTALTNVFGEKNVATMILLGKDSRLSKDSRRSKAVAEKLEAAQFKKWFVTDKLDPEGVLLNVMKVNPSRIQHYRHKKGIWDDYDKFYNKNK